MFTKRLNQLHKNKLVIIININRLDKEATLTYDNISNQ